jgi:hypothetical protein
MPKLIIDAETEEAVDPQVGYVDGYHFGDRLLEGVMFEITLDENRELQCKGVVNSAQSYVKKFSKKQMTEWCKSAVEMALEDSLVTLDGRRDLIADEVP